MDNVVVFYIIMDKSSPFNIKQFKTILFNSESKVYGLHLIKMYSSLSMTKFYYGADNRRHHV